MFNLACWNWSPMTHHKLGECTVRCLKENVLSLWYKCYRKDFHITCWAWLFATIPYYSCSTPSGLPCLPYPLPSLSPTSPCYTPPLLFIIALALWDPLVNPGITHPRFKGMKMQPGLCHQFTLFPLSSAETRNAKLLPHESVWAPQWERVLVISGPVSEQRAREGRRD